MEGLGGAHGTARNCILRWVALLANQRLSPARAAQQRVLARPCRLCLARTREAGTQPGALPGGSEREETNELEYKPLCTAEVNAEEDADQAWPSSASKAASGALAAKGRTAQASAPHVPNAKSRLRLADFKPLVTNEPIRLHAA